MVVPDDHHPTPPDDESICKNLFEYLSRHKKAFNQVVTGNLIPGLAIPEDEDATCLVVTKEDVGEALGVDIPPMDMYETEEDEDSYRFIIQLAMHIPKTDDQLLASNAKQAAEILLDCWNAAYIKGDFPQAHSALWKVNDQFGEISAE
jgi:hypothetical protein